MFFQPKHLDSVEYTRLHNEILDCTRAVQTINADLERIDEALKSFKGRFYQHLKNELTEEEAPPQGKSLNKPFTPFMI
jgi:hypothetical protein